MEFVNMTAKEYRQMISGGKGNKYHAKKVECNGVVFDSIKEKSRWLELCKMESCGMISSLERQVRFILQEGFVANDGKKVRPISYLADAYYYDVKKKTWVVEDTKSTATRTEVYKIKKKLFQAKYKDILFVEYIKK